MKKFTISLLLLVGAGSVFAGHLDLRSRIALKRHVVEKNISSPFFRESSVGINIPRHDDNSCMAFVSVREGYGKDDLENAGMKVLAIRGDVAVVALPADSAYSFASARCVKKMSIEQPVKASMDLSRADAGVDDIHAGKTLNLPYSGKGVLTGIVDEGMDPNHISFFDENGVNRVKYLTYLDGSYDRNGIPVMNYYGDQIYYLDDSGKPVYYPTIDKFTTDELGTYHGTHTMNILAGSYRGEVKVPDAAGGTTSISNPYYGVAYDSEIAASCGYLSDACIAWGINGILDYAAAKKEAEGTPSVLNLSLGFAGGAHDPEGLMNRYLEECGKETIIVVASGNEGDMPIALHKDLTADDNKIASMIYPYGFRYDPSAGEPSSANTYIRNGAVMVYSIDDTPFTLKAFVMTCEDGIYRRRATLDIGGEEGKYYLSDNFYADYVGGAVNSTVARYFNGYIGGGSMFDEDLGRYYGVVDYYLYTLPETGIASDGSEAVIVGFEITGEDGQRVECYCEGSNTWISNYGVAGYDDGSRDGTISDMAVGRNILVVGAYNLRDTWKTLDGTDYRYSDDNDFTVGAIGEYTSYGTLADGRQLPHVCAPGTAIVSAVSSPYVEALYDGYEAYIPANFQASASVGGKDYYWRSETGTSMSTPFVAGSIALWLEADPTLTIDDVIDIINKTSRKDEFVEKGNPVQWGAGKFDALAGLKEVIMRTGAGVEGIVADNHNDRLILREVAPRRFEIFVGNAAVIDVQVFSLAGNCVWQAKAEGCETVADLSQLAPGVYIVKANNHTAKIRLR